MFGRSFDLFTIFGFKIRLDLSWFVVAVLVTWSLAEGYFPSVLADTPRATYWAMGAVGALLLFASVVAHELSHALTARRFGLEMRGITLFIFGGVAEMSDEPPSAKAEFWVAIAGPIASVLIAVAFFALRIGLGLPATVAEVVGYLATINLVLAVFNMIPAFPLDGGRILRSALWQWRGDLRWATRVTSTIGSGFGTLLIVLGVVMLVTGSGDFVSAMWMGLIGLFLRSAAQRSYQQLLLRRTLEGEPVSRFMQTEPVTVPRHLSVEELVREYVYRHHFKLFPVVDGERLVGCVTTRQIKELPREEWGRTSVGALAEACSDENAIRPGADAMQALSRMSGGRVSRLMVVDDTGRLVGILALKDLLAFLSLKIELEG